MHSFWLPPHASSQVGLQLLFEGFPPAVNQRLGRRNRATKHFGDLLIAQFVLAAERDGQALVFGQITQHLGDLGLQFAVQQVFGRRGSLNILKLVQRLVRLVRVFAPGSAQQASATSDYTWVPRTPALTRLINHPQIPDGFTQVPPD